MDDYLTNERLSGQEEMEKENNSYFYKFFISFMLTLCIPFLSIIVLFVQAEAVVENQIEIANRDTLNQFFRLVDNITEERKRKVYY